MIKDKYKRKLIEYRRKNGLCIYCGEVSDNGVSCEPCRAKRNVALKMRRAKRTANGICPRCGKNEIFGDEKNCIECRFNSFEYTQEHRDRETYNRQHREWERRVNQELRDAGICPRCKKRKADSGYKTCGICRAKAKEYYTAKKSKPNRAERQAKQGLCFFCDRPIKPKYKVCEVHYQMNVDNANLPQTKEARKEIQKYWC